MRLRRALQRCPHPPQRCPHPPQRCPHPPQRCPHPPRCPQSRPHRPTRCATSLSRAGWNGASRDATDWPYLFRRRRRVESSARLIPSLAGGWYRKRNAPVFPTWPSRLTTTRQSSACHRRALHRRDALHAWIVVGAGVIGVIFVIGVIGVIGVIRMIVVIVAIAAVVECSNFRQVHVVGLGIHYPVHLGDC